MQLNYSLKSRHLKRRQNKNQPATYPTHIQTRTNATERREQYEKQTSKTE